ncbi:MAG: hypothetical protein Q4C61_07490 [Lachnospiraceae bacterium]|nr:hypothetical protein [Lachnospiraceae bacterium]
MKKKHLALLLGSTLALSVAGSSFCAMAEEAQNVEETENLEETANQEETDFLSKIQGSYIELFPEMDREEYRDIWLKETSALVGEENADAATDKLLGMCMANIYGQEAIDKYGDGSEGIAFDCYFLGGVSEFTVQGDTISGTDEEGNEVFSHVYDYVDTDENGFFLYQSEDENSGQFTYFSFAPDTMEETYHLEFRYSEDASDLESWFEGAYAYWNVGAIAADYDDAAMEAAIHLFATENLSEE